MKEEMLTVFNDVDQYLIKAQDSLSTAINYLNQALCINDSGYKKESLNDIKTKIGNINEDINCKILPAIEKM